MIVTTSQLTCLKRCDSRKFQNRKIKGKKCQTEIDTTKKSYLLEMIVREYVPYYVYELTKNTEVNYKDDHKFFPSICPWVIPSYSGSELGHVICSSQ